MGIYKAEAIVLRSLVYGEADRILDLFTKERGKVAAIARGVRKPNSRLRGAVQLFSHTRLVLYTGKSLDTVTQGEAEEDFSHIQNDLQRLATASYCAELVGRLTLQNQPMVRLFQLLLDAFGALRESDPELVARIFEVQLLAVLGYRPRLDSCESHREWQSAVSDGETGPIWFSIERGGVLCPVCAAQTSGVRAISPATAGALAYFLRAPLDRAVRVKLGRACSEELASLLCSFLSYHIEVRPRSREFLDKLRDNR